MLVQAWGVVGGAEKQLASLAPVLHGLGVEVHVVTRATATAAAFEQPVGAVVHQITVRGGRVRSSLGYTWGALRLLRRLRPDVVHAHDLFSPATIACLAKPLTGSRALVKPNAGGKGGNIARVRARPFGGLRLAIYRRMIDGFVVISDEIDDELAAFGVAVEHRYRVPNGVDVDHFAPPAAEAKQAARRQLDCPDGPLVVYTGRFARVKGTDVLLAAWPLVRQQCPEAHLLLVGTPRDPGVPSWSTDQPGVVVHAPVNDVAPMLCAADVYVNASLSEGLSNSVLEAFATGLPVVATGIAGNQVVVEDGVTGWLVEPGDPVSLASGLVAAISEPTSARGAAARQLVVDSYSLASVAERLRDLYLTITAL